MAQRIDYKFRQVLRDGAQTVATVAFYTGEDALAADELTGEPVAVYRRTAKVGERVLMFRGDVSDDDIRSICNEWLATMLPAYPGRTVLAVQVVKAASRVRPISDEPVRDDR